LSTQKMFASCLVPNRVSRITASILVVVAGVHSAYGESPPPKSNGDLVSVQEMIDSRTDVWGDAAMRQPDGASYEFFKDLLPPLRWVNTDFRHYPIVLSAPRAARKVRLVSNGSAVNARANKLPMWQELGTPVNFYVGDSAEAFGDDLARLETPTYLDGYLPIVADGKQIRIENAPTTFGPISLVAESKLSAGYVDVHVTPPPRAAKTVLLRAPLPTGWKVTSVEIDGRLARLDSVDGVDLSGRTTPTSVKFRVKVATERH
jgi:hypothetical protein